LRLAQRSRPYYFALTGLNVSWGLSPGAARLRRLPLATLFRAFGAASDRYNGGAAFAACPWLTYFAPSALRVIAITAARLSPLARG